MNKLQIFNNSHFGNIRVSTDENNEPLFCLADLCRALELKDVTSTSRKIDGDDKHLLPLIDSMGRHQATTFVTESGMYTVILRSDSPLAKPMQKWVTSEVLPAIRKHGVFATESAIEKLISDPDSFIRILTELKNERIAKQQLEQDNQIQQIQLEAQVGKVLFANAVSVSVTTIPVGTLAKLICQNGIDIGRNRLFVWMRETGYLNSVGKSYNLPSQKSMDLELLEVKEGIGIKPDGTSYIQLTPMVTGKGQQYFINKFVISKPVVVCLP
jgi:anti-repressor protein